MVYEEAGKPSYKDCIALTPKVQRNAVGQKPLSSVVISLLYSSAFVRYSNDRRITKEEDEMRKMLWTFKFYMLAHFRVKEQVSLSSV